MKNTLLIFLAVIGSACAGIGAPALPDAEPTAVSVDLDDPEQMELLGSPEPSDIVWQRTVAGVTILGQTAAPDLEELEIMELALRSLPEILPNRLRYIVRSPDSSNLVSGDPFAAAQGPDIYVFDATFSRELSPVFSLRRALIHELVHVEQFATLDPLHVGALLSGAEARVLLTNSTIVTEFTGSTGWTLSGSTWVAPARTSNAYGATGPTEDMAEAVAKALSGESDQLPAEHLEAVAHWLSIVESELKQMSPWIPEGAEEVGLDTDLFDTEIVSSLAGEGRFDIISFTLDLDSPSTAQLTERIETMLQQNGLTGDMALVDDPTIARSSGQFLMPDGTIYWVELRDFREAPGFSGGPEVPVLIYVIIW